MYVSLPLRVTRDWGTRPICALPAISQRSREYTPTALVGGGWGGKEYLIVLSVCEVIFAQIIHSKPHDRSQRCRGMRKQRSTPVVALLYFRREGGFHTIVYGIESLYSGIICTLDKRFFEMCRRFSYGNYTWKKRRGGVRWQHES